MYVPRYAAVDVEECLRMVRALGSAQLVTVGADGTPEATLLPTVLAPSPDDSGGAGCTDGLRIIMHMARANPHWRHIAAGARTLAIVTAAQAYVSPSWYPSKREHGRVVPTWNYSAVHLSGTVTVHDDPDWTRAAVTELTHAHEDMRAYPWAVTDAPAAFVHGQLQAIVGVEMTVERIEGKAKLSQNRPASDRAGVIEGLSAEPDAGSAGVAAAMRRLPPR